MSEKINEDGLAANNMGSGNIADPKNKLLGQKKGVLDKLRKRMNIR